MYCNYWILQDLGGPFSSDDIKLFGLEYLRQDSLLPINNPLQQRLVTNLLSPGISLILLV